MYGTLFKKEKGHPFAMMKIHWSTIIIAFISFNFAQANPAVSKAGNYAVPRGSTVRMDCMPRGARVDKSSVAGKKSFVWTDEEGREVVNPRAEVLATGQLQILHAHEDDSGIYHCKFRTKAALRQGGAPGKIFVHKLIVYELSGHKFVTVVAFDVTKIGSEATISLLRQTLRSKICARKTCAPGPVRSEKCELDEDERQICEMSMTYLAVEATQTERCNESCVRDRMLQQLREAQRALEASLLISSEDSHPLLKPDLRTFDTKHVITCKSGYHLIESNYEHCFPCLPGTYSEEEASKCEPCPIGFYQEKYGARRCEQCRDDKTTKTVGSRSRYDCRNITDTGILTNIKESIASLFNG